MAIHYDKLIALQLPEVRHTFTEKDVILYALGLGLGQDPMDEAALAFLYEEGLKVLPTNAVVLAWPGFWVRDIETGIDWLRVVHGEQGLRLHRPIPPRGTVIGRSRVVDIIDKGPGRGALLLTERTIVDEADGALLATMTQTTFCRGDGGFGGPQRPTPPAHRVPSRAPDLVCDLPTRPEQALLYRLSGDPNPIHAVPRIAAEAGFPRPILHGLATFGIAGYAILKTLCDHDPGKLQALEGRFSAPVFPGETIRTEIWREGSALSFQARVIERDLVVFSNGKAELGA